MRDDRPFGGLSPPAAMFHYTPDRTAVHPRRHLALYAGLLQADAYAGFDELYREGRAPGTIIEAGCWAHGRRKLFALADLARARIAIEAGRRLDAIFEPEGGINGRSAEQRGATRRDIFAPMVGGLEAWMHAERARLSRHNEVAKAMDYMLKRWTVLARFLEDGRICLPNNAAGRALRGIAIGRKAWLFAGSDRGGERTAAIGSLIVTARFNDVDPVHGSPTRCAASPTSPPNATMSCCPGTTRAHYEPSRPQPELQNGHYRTDTTAPKM